MTRRAKHWVEYPLRTCRSLHWCNICESNITLGEQYRDGGFNKRVHEKCRLKQNEATRAVHPDWFGADGELLRRTP